MSDRPTIEWPGQSGREYTYYIFPMEDASFKAEPGNYVYAKETSPNKWKPVYIGQTENLKGRLADHNEERCARRNGATHIHAHLNRNGEEARVAEEKDLIQRWDPACNEVYVD